MDIDKTLVNLLTSNNLTDKEKKYLKGICQVYDCSSIEELKYIIPISWVNRCSIILDDHQFPGLWWYASDYGMDALRKMRENKDINEYEDVKLSQLNNEFMLMPKTDKPFTVFRGVLDIPDKYFSYNRPVSGSFLPEISSQYTNDKMMVINIPRDSSLLYCDSCDQVIFPQNSRFEVKLIKEKTWFIDNYITDMKYTTYYVDLLI